MNPHQRCLQAKVKYRDEPKTGNAKEWRPNALDKAEKAGASAQDYIMWYNHS